MNAFRFDNTPACYSAIVHLRSFNATAAIDRFSGGRQRKRIFRVTTLRAPRSILLVDT